MNAARRARLAYTKDMSGGQVSTAQGGDRGPGPANPRCRLAISVESDEQPGGNSVLDRLVCAGLLTRDVEDAFRDATGELLIQSAVREITN